MGSDYVIDQSRYALNLTEKFSKCVTLKPRSTPLPCDVILSKKDMATTESHKKEVESLYGKLHYRSAIGALIYLSSGTRPDITFAVGKLAKFSESPGPKHYKALVWLLGYVRHTGPTTKG